MYTIPQNDAAFEKAIKVIDSCKKHTHINCATNYISLYFNKTKDIDGFRKLVERLNNQIGEIK